MAGKAFSDSFLTWQEVAKEEKEVFTAVKSDEELAKFTVDARLSDVERTILYFSGGQPIQQRCAITNLVSVLRGRGRPAWDAVAPSFKGALPKLDAEGQAEAAQAFAAIAKERVLGPSDLQVCLLPIICRNINKEKSEEEIEAWMQALFAVIPFLDKEVLKSEVVALALSKGDVEESVNSRCICVRILGAVAKCLSREEVERSFFKKAISMCQDVHFQVRIAMCQQLLAIGRTVGGELLAKQILEELLELLKDEEGKVRGAAFTALVEVLELLPPDVRRARALPVLRSHMQPFDLEGDMQAAVARCFGQMLTLVKGDLEPDDLQLFFGCFRHLTSKGDDALRAAAAQQLPVVLRTAAALSSNPAGVVHQAQLLDVVAMLVQDSGEEVRVAAAEQLHEVARLAGPDAGATMTRPLVRLLRDPSPRVQAAALSKLGLTLAALAPASDGKGAALSDARREALTSDIVRALVDLEAAAGARQWRTQQRLAAAFPSFPRAFTSDQIYEHFVPMALRMLSGSAAAVRPSAAEGLAQFLRYGRKEAQRADTFRRIVREFARAKSFTQRGTFSHIARHLIAAFSSRFVKDWVFDLCLELLYDPVPNVRLQFSPLLPSLKQVIRLPEDVDLLERLNTAVSNAMTDLDRDVSVGARTANDAFKRLPVRMGMGTQVVEVNGVMGGGSSYETMDRKREEEEAELPSFTPEDAKEIKAEISGNGARRRAANGPGAASAAASAASETAGRAPAVRRSGGGTAAAAVSSSSSSPSQPARGGAVRPAGMGTGLTAGAAAAAGARGGAAATSAAAAGTGARGAAASAASSSAASSRVAGVASSPSNVLSPAKQGAYAAGAGGAGSPGSERGPPLERRSVPVQPTTSKASTSPLKTIATTSAGGASNPGAAAGSPLRGPSSSSSSGSPGAGKVPLPGIRAATGGGTGSPTHGGAASAAGRMGVAPTASPKKPSK